MRVLLPVVLLLCTGSLPVVAAAAPQEKSLGASAIRHLEHEGLDHFYNLEYDQAIVIFQKLRDAQPDNPVWHNHLAAAYFYKQLLIAGTLQGDLFASSRKIFHVKKIQPDPELERNFWKANDAAIRLCETRLKQDEEDQKALYACGVAYAERGFYQGLIQHSKVATLESARKASDYHVRLLEHNSRYYDAYLIPGLYDYVLGSLPKSLRILLYIAGFSGDKARGIQAVQSTAKWGNDSRADARILLVVMYRREKRYADARRVLGELAQAYPRNYIFPLEIASVYRRSGHPKQAIRMYETVLNDIRKGRPGYDRAPLARIHFELGDLYWKAGDLEAAKRHFEKVDGAIGSSPALEKADAERRHEINRALRERSAAEPAPRRRCCG